MGLEVPLSIGLMDVAECQDSFTFHVALPKENSIRLINGISVMPCGIGSNALLVIGGIENRTSRRWRMDNSTCTAWIATREVGSRTFDVVLFG
ncbi:hypothetical protein QYF36_024610 [Acer negundo]|nr:hypothetical protein QYF36_024610 [Acer negundo]